VSDADVEAAAALLADALVVADAEDAKAAALDDAIHQDEVMADAIGLADDDALVGNYSDKAIGEDVVADAEERKAEDEAAIAEAEDTIGAAYDDAAAALAVAGLVDAANVDAVAGVIADAWVVDTE
jgi:hypothetical protein